MARLHKYAVMAMISGLLAAGSARADNPPPLTVNNVGDGKHNKTTVDPKAGQTVNISNSDNGKGNTLVVKPDKNGTVIINADGNGKGNKIVVDKAPGEKVVIEGSGNGKNNNIKIVNEPGTKQGKGSSKGHGPVANNNSNGASHSGQGPIVIQGGTIENPSSPGSHGPIHGLPIVNKTPTGSSTNANGPIAIQGGTIKHTTQPVSITKSGMPEGRGHADHKAATSYRTASTGSHGGRGRK